MIKKMFLVMIIIGIITVSFVSADIIPENSHSLNKCIKFVNLNKFPNVILIGYYTGPMVDTYESYQIKNNSCLKKGYKFNSLNIYWTTKEKFNNLDIKNLNVTNLNLLSENVESYGGYIDNSTPLIKKIIEYSIAGFKDGNLIVYRSKQTSEYNNGQPNKVETFDKPSIDSKELIQKSISNLNKKPINKQQRFISKIKCFFKILFGKNC